jgi:ssDNA-binding protein
MAEKRQYHISPAGIAQYPRLTKPDTKFKADGEYKVTLVLPGAEAQPLIELIDNAMGESLVKARKENPAKAKTIKAATDKPYKAVTDDEGNETGEYKFNFKMAAKVTSKKNGSTWEQKPALFDAKLKPLVDPKIGGGSTVKVKFEMYQFYTALVGAGVSLRLLAVQVLDLVEYSKSGSEGFEAGEGYEAEEQEAPAPATKPAPADVAQDEDDEVPF